MIPVRVVSPVSFPPSNLPLSGRWEEGGGEEEEEEEGSVGGVTGIT